MREGRAREEEEKEKEDADTDADGRAGGRELPYLDDWNWILSILPEVGLKPSSGFSAVMRAAMTCTGYSDCGL